MAAAAAEAEAPCADINGRSAFGIAFGVGAVLDDGVGCPDTSWEGIFDETSSLFHP